MNHSLKPPVERLPHHGGVIRLVQVTDTHLSENPGGMLLGMDTDQSLQHVIDRVKEERGTPDVLLLTGDLSDHGSASAYTRMDSYSRQLSDVSFWLPGNHDDFASMSETLAGTACMSSDIQIGNWQIIMLDSQVPGQAGGALGAGQLALLKAALQRASEVGLFTLVCLHHHPVKIGCAWLDEQMVADAAAFFEILDGYSGVKAVLWGHVHQRVDKVRNGVALMGSPSSCVQFAPGSEQFKADDSPPGYRWLDLLADGSIDTDVSRVEGVQFIVDLDSDGYL
ncbi:MAG: 3',5'-cyclic-AMP phosphodiesterase [Halioglobus sp.]